MMVKFGSMVEWLQCRLVTPCGTGSNPVRAAKKSSEAVIVFSRLKHEKGFRVMRLQAIDTNRNPAQT